MIPALAKTGAVALALLVVADVSPLPTAGTVTALGGFGAACVGLVVVMVNRRYAREDIIERRRDAARKRAAETLTEAQRDRDSWRDRYWDMREKCARVEARLERVLEQYQLPSAAGRSGEYPPYGPPTEPR